MRKTAVIIALSLICRIMPAEQPIRICSACGREDLTGAETCECGNKLPPIKNEKDTEPVKEAEKKGPTGSLPEAVKEAKADVEAARGFAKTNPLLSYALYQNALALLSADTTGANRAASDSLSNEINEAKKARLAQLATYSTVESARIALKKCNEDAALHHKTLGRKALGHAWIPVQWSDELIPLQISAIRQTVPPVCASCAGLGYESSCRECGGKKLTPCRAKGCDHGWVTVTPLNTLNPKNATKTKQKCQTCKGNALVPCKTCSGKGTTFCKKCKGTGEAPLCTSCRGDGLVPCKECEKKLSKDPNTDTSSCRKCRGTLKIICSRCGGDGRTER